MRKIIAAILIVLFSGSAVAQNVVVESPKTGSVFWDILAHILGIMAVPVMTLLIKIIFDWQAKLAAEKEVKRSSMREKLKYEAESVIARIAANIANKQLVDIKEAAKDGKIDKTELKKLGEQAIAQAKAELGPSVAKTVGDQALESILRKKVDDMRPK